MNFCVLFMLTLTFGVMMAWEYELVGVEAHSRTDMMTSDLKVKRVGRGRYAINGTVTINEDFDNSVMVEVKMYRSPLGNNQYQLLPLRIYPTHLYEFLSRYYKAIMDDVKDHTNFIKLDEFNSPIPKGSYYVIDYEISKDKFPSYVQEGVYKIVALVKSETVDFEQIFIARITSVPTNQ